MLIDRLNAQPRAAVHIPQVARRAGAGHPRRPFTPSAVAECSVSIGGFSRSSGLSFSYSANASSGSFNEMLSVESDSQSMYFNSLGMQRHHERGAQLSEQGAAEYF